MKHFIHKKRNNNIDFYNPLSTESDRNRQILKRNKNFLRLHFYIMQSFCTAKSDIIFIFFFIRVSYNMTFTITWNIL
ncbi:unnamed protein product [Brugia timori]|uniref:Uncharacterized protein n=1 Tax=Brugia timori TaxID=42155 RepID=A0A0R3R9G2_9BILA|nr:unnamed protein product [Brugia timori]